MGNEDNLLKETLTLLLKHERDRKQELLKEFKRAPDGDLVIKRTGERLFLYRKDDCGINGIMGERKLSRALARKCYVKKQIFDCENNITVLNGSIKRIDRLSCSGSKLLHKKTYDRLETVFPEKHYLYSPKQLKWMFSYYERNPFKPEQLKYRTKSGIMVRSKSERTIADLLTEQGILFHYEEKMIINGHAYYPDFVILTENGRLIVWEHFGLMDNEEYFIKAYSKLKNYRAAGYFTHTNLICTYEEDIVSSERLQGIIKRYLS